MILPDAIVPVMLLTLWSVLPRNSQTDRFRFRSTDLGLSILVNQICGS